MGAGHELDVDRPGGGAGGDDRELSVRGLVLVAALLFTVIVTALVLGASAIG